MKIKYKINKNCKCSCHPNKIKEAIGCTECIDYSHKNLPVDTERTIHNAKYIDKQ